MYKPGDNLNYYLDLMYTAEGPQEQAELYMRWSDMQAARAGTTRLLQHMRGHGLPCKCTNGHYEPFSGTFEVVVKFGAGVEQREVNAAILTPLL